MKDMDGERCLQATPTPAIAGSVSVATGGVAQDDGLNIKEEPTEIDLDAGPAALQHMDADTRYRRNKRNVTCVKEERDPLEETSTLESEPSLMKEASGLQVNEDVADSQQAATMEHGASEHVEEQSHREMIIKIEIEEAAQPTAYNDNEINLNYIKKEPGLINLMRREPGLTMKKEAVEDSWQDIAEQQSVQGASTAANVGSTKVFASSADLDTVLNLKEQLGPIDIGSTVLFELDLHDRSKQPDISVKQENAIHHDVNYPMPCSTVKKNIIEVRCGDAQPSKKETRPAQQAQSWPYKCIKCPKSYKWKSALNIHCKRIHGTQSYECTECNVKFKCKEFLVRHVRNAHSKQQYECTICKKMCKSKEALRAHVIRCHRCKSADGQSEPVQRAQSRPYRCDKCAKTYKNSSTLYSHCKREHETGSYKCTQCNLEYRCKEYLMTHVRNVHSKQRYECTICKKMCKTKQVLYNHIARYHGPTAFQPCIYICDYCQKTFTSKPCIQTHITHMHARGSYKCNQCNKCFKYEQYLIRHTTNIHSDKHLNYRHGQQSAVSSPVYPCDYCQKTYARKHSLFRHIDSVHGKGFHRCSECKVDFKYKQSFKKHMKMVHSKEESHQLYTCSNCGKDFKSKWNCQRHEKSSKCTRPTTGNQNAVAGTSTQQLNVNIAKEESADGELELGPVVFQHMDCNYRPYS